MTISYTLWGEVDVTQEAWERFTEDALNICDMLGFAATHYDISTVDAFYSRLGKIGGIKRRLANLRKKEEEVIDNATIVSLPEDFRSVIFDFIVTLSRNSSRYGVDYVTLIINKEYTGDINVDEEKVIGILSKHIAAVKGEIYEVSISADPEGYAANPEAENAGLIKRSIKSIKKFCFDKEGKRYDL